MRPKPTDPSVAKQAIETGSDDGVFWPGDALLRPGTINKTTKKMGSGEIVEETRLPEIRNDGKLYNDKDSTSR